MAQGESPHNPMSWKAHVDPEEGGVHGDPTTEWRACPPLRPPIKREGGSGFVYYLGCFFRASLWLQVVGGWGVQGHFTVLGLGMAPWGFSDEETGAADGAGALTGLAFWGSARRRRRRHHHRKRHHHKRRRREEAVVPPKKAAPQPSASAGQITAPHDGSRAVLAKSATRTQLLWVPIGI